MIRVSDSIEVGKQEHIDNLLASRYNYSDPNEWIDRDRVEEIKRGIK